jgi:chlorobactene glucosyltransferase
MAWLLWRNQTDAMRLELAPDCLALPLVSLLVPARNEAHNLSTTLPLFLKSDYPNLEIIVLDDQSEDETGALLARAATMDSRLRVISGQPLPPGHNGKNWACQQLANEANGAFLVFCDADVSLGSRAISQSVAHLQHNGAGILTAVPGQRLGSWSEHAIVPLVIHVSTLMFVSLNHAFRSASSLFTVANGQWMVFRRSCYRAIGGHAAVKDAIVEDMALCRRAKRFGFRVCTVVAFAQLSVRMYRSFSEVWEGFSKNLFGLMGYQVRNVVIVACFAFFSSILPWVMACWQGGWWWMLVAFLVLLRAELARFAGHSWASVLMHPLGVLMLFVLGLDSMIRSFRGRLTWKDRTLVQPQAVERS